YINGLSALIGGLSLFIYAFIYTPLKQKTSFSVIVGAIAGAAPPVIGYTAAFGQIDSIAWMLFGIQFVWQLPHFWALAWVLNDEYNKAGFYLLPSKKGRTKKSALITFISALLLMPVVYLSYYVGATNIVITILMGLASLHFIHQAYTLYKTRELKEARTLMFGSFYYLPIVQTLLIIAHFIN
ncbi:MAG: protoheme IX farnesyltransferase, partial [Bacteroidales bacterium]|nr:protoheme IX farnesyltransferase [Bacteroidales bacterium]